MIKTNYLKIIINKDGTTVFEKYINDIDKLITLGVGPNFNFEREKKKT